MEKRQLIERVTVEDYMYWSKNIEYKPVYQLGDNMHESINMLREVETILEMFPDLDCGSCGAPSCRALAEDIVRGQASKNDCIHIVRDYIHRLSEDINMLDNQRKNNDI